MVQQTFGEKLMYSLQTFGEVNVQFANFTERTQSCTVPMMFFLSLDFSIVGIFLF